MGFAYHDGGGIYAEDSTLNFTANTTVKFNRARIGGGAVSVLVGSLNFTDEIHFINNSALRGGALYLKYKSSLRLPHKNETVIHMVGNTAVEYGGAIYVQDVNPFGYCLPGVLPNTSEDFIYIGNGYNVYGTNCFFEPLESPSEISHNHSSHPKVLFSANFAQQAGHALFGGSVDNCKLKWRYEDYYKSSSNAYNNIFQFEGNSNVSSESMVSSEPYIVCGCVDGAKKCSLPQVSKQVYPGKTFILPAVTVGQRNGIVPSLVRASLENQQNISTSRVLMEIQGTYTSCSDLHITVFSSVSHKKLHAAYQGILFSVWTPSSRCIGVTFLPTWVHLVRGRMHP